MSDRDNQPERGASAAGAPARVVLALDGHDGSGKTTLARRLAETLGAVYVRPYAPPSGERMLGCALAGDFEAAWSHAQHAMAHALETCASAPIVILDRAWLTPYTLVPERLRSSGPLPVPSVVCWADLSTTVQRLRLRGEIESCDDLESHRQYLALYWRLCERYGCKLLRTDQLDEEQALTQLVDWATSHLT